MLTLGLIAITVVVSWLAFDRPRLLDRLLLWSPAVERQRQYDRLLTHGFVHADWSHLLFNMITLYFFGRLIERVLGELMGPIGFPLFYLSAIVVAMLPSYLRHRHDPHYRSLGASGGVSAVLFAYILLDPWAWIFVFFVPMPAIVYAVAYVAYSFYMDRRGGDNINHSAHLSGALYGVLFMVLLEPRVLGHFAAAVLSPRGP